MALCEISHVMHRVACITTIASGEGSRMRFENRPTTEASSFSNTVREWIEEKGEVLVLFRYSRLAGNRDWEFFDSFRKFNNR
jgi:hypothetical protein